MVDTSETQTNSTDADELAQILKAGSDSLRLLILNVLRQNAFGVLELTHLFNTTQPAMSHHLKVMNQAGLVEGRREGTSIFYRRKLLPSSPMLAEAMAGIYKAADHLDLGETVQQRLQTLYQERGSRSQAFFAANAQGFEQQQEQIADFSVYAEQTLQLLDGCIDQKNNVLEIGPGNGAFLDSLHSRFTHVCAIDNSPDMLAKAESTVGDKQLKNVELVLGECSDLIATQNKYDAVVANMVLHHIPSPADIFIQVSELLNDHGNFIFTDLCQHEQSWTAEACGDLWQGFSDTEIQNWAQSAGLTPTAQQVSALKNGFQIQSWSLQKATTSPLNGIHKQLSNSRNAQ